MSTHDEVPERWQRDAVIRSVIESARTIAVVGLSPRPERASHDVAAYIQRQGYRVIPVNPKVDEVLGEVSYPSLSDIGEHVDLVSVFRRPEFTPAIARQAAEIGAGTIWFQIGVINHEAGEIAERGGLNVVMDRCFMVEHRWLRG